MREKRKVHVSGKRTILTYDLLHSAVDMALDQAESTTEGSFYNCLFSIVMNAFCLEAYLNHIGSGRFSDWDSTLSPLDKLKRITEEVGIKIDYGKRPFQSIKLVNQFRNELAHGKTEELNFSYQETFKPENKVKYPIASWEAKCNIKKAKQYRDDLESVVGHIQSFYRPGSPTFGIQGFSEAMSTLET